MKIKKNWDFVNRELSITDAIELACYEDQGGTFDQLNACQAKTAELIGRLVERLNNRGLLTNADVLTVLGGGYEEVA